MYTHVMLAIICRGLWYLKLRVIYVAHRPSELGMGEPDIVAVIL